MIVDQAVYRDGVRRECGDLSDELTALRNDSSPDTDFLWVGLKDPTPEEFESWELNREKVIDLGLGTDEGRDPLASPLVCRRGLLRERVRPAVRRRVEALVELALGIEDGDRLVRGRAGVEVDERRTVAHGAREDREVGPDAGDLLGGERRRGHGSGPSGVDGSGQAFAGAAGVAGTWKRS